jgi:hypothetical protein
MLWERVEVLEIGIKEVLERLAVVEGMCKEMDLRRTGVSLTTSGVVSGEKRNNTYGKRR